MSLIIQIIMMVITLSLLLGLGILIYFSLKPFIIAFKHRKKIDKVIQIFKTMSKDDAIEQIIKIGITDAGIVRTANEKLNREVENNEQRISISADEERNIKKKADKGIWKIFGRRKPKGADRTDNKTASPEETRTITRAEEEARDRTEYGRPIEPIKDTGRISNDITSRSDVFKRQRPVQLQSAPKTRPASRFFE